MLNIEGQLLICFSENRNKIFYVNWGVTFSFCVFVIQ